MMTARPELISTGLADPVPAELDVSLLDAVVALAESWRMIVFGALAVGVAALGLSFLIQPTFTARTVLIAPQQGGMAAAALAQLGSLAGLATGASGLKNPADQYVAMLRSTTIAERLVERFGLVKVYGEDFRVDARRVLAERSSISAGKDGLISIEVDDHSPERSAEIANAYVEEFGTLLDRLAVTEAQQRRVFFEKQLSETQVRLVQAQEALQSTGVDAAALRMIPQGALEVVARLKAQVTAQELRISAMRGYLAETSPDLRQALTELAALRAQLRQVEASEPRPSGVGGDYLARYREFKYQETLFELFARQFELAKVDEAREGAVVQVVDPATVPEKKSRPKKALIAILATLVAGVLLAIAALVGHAWRSMAVDPQAAGKVASIRAALRWRRRAPQR